MRRYLPSKGTTFLANVRMNKKGHCEASIPPHVVERENLKKGSVVRWKVEEIQEDD